jgi:hypothetical protein
VELERGLSIRAYFEPYLNTMPSYLPPRCFTGSTWASVCVGISPVKSPPAATHPHGIILTVTLWYRACPADHASYDLQLFLQHDTKYYSYSTACAHTCVGFTLAMFRL